MYDKWRSLITLSIYMALHEAEDTPWMSCRRRQLGVIIFVARRCSALFDIEHEAKCRITIEVVAMQSLAPQKP